MGAMKVADRACHHRNTEIVHRLRYWATGSRASTTPVSYASVIALQVLMFRACEPMRMMHMFVRCHVYLEYHLNISKFSGRATT